MNSVNENLSLYQKNQEFQFYTCSYHLLQEYADKFCFSRLAKGSEFSHGEDVAQFLKKIFEKPKKEVRNALRVNPEWFHGSLLRVQTNLWFLQDGGFTQTEIWNNLSILLYPTDELKKQLDQLESRPEVDCCRDENGRLKPEMRLQLVLYFMEQPFHFTGNGIWKEGNISSKNLPSELSSDEPTAKVHVQ